ncbi:MAG: TRAP transporter small permease [Bacteroidota bacterium]
MTTRLENILKLLQQKIDKVNKAFVILMLAAMVLLVATNVFMRYVLNTGLQWTEDIVTLFFSYLIFFSIPIAFRSGAHIRIVFFTEKLPKKAKILVNFLVDFLILILFILVFTMSLDAINSIGDSPYGALKYPMSFFYYAVAISCILLFFDFIVKIMFDIKTHVSKNSKIEQQENSQIRSTE